MWLKVDGNAWVKCYSELVGMWQWMFKMDVGHGDTERPPKYTLSAGTHTIKLSGRSNGFRYRFPFALLFACNYSKECQYPVVYSMRESTHMQIPLVAF